MDAVKNKLKVIMIGATGATGKAVVPRMLALESLERLTLLVRKQSDAFGQDPRLIQRVVDFDHLEKEMFVDHNAIVSTFGTTKVICFLFVCEKKLCSLAHFYKKKKECCWQCGELPED